MSRPWLVAACLIACAGCDKTSPQTTDPTAKSQTSAAAAQPKTDPAITAALDLLGDGAPVVGIFDGRSWPKVHQRLTPVMQHLPPALGQQFAAAKDLPGVLSALGRMGLGQGLDTLHGIDPKRPAAFALNEASASGPPGIALAAIDFEKPTPLRHEIVLPASDAKALEASLRAILAKAGKPHAKGYDLGELQVDVKAEGDWVRVAALMPARPDGVEQMWRAPRAPSTVTPAYQRLASPGAGLAMLVRPWRLRVAYGQHGANQMQFAMGSMGPAADMRMQLFAKGLSIVLNGAALMHASRPDFEDSVVRLVGDDAGVHLEGVHTLSATAKPAMEQAIAKGGRVLKLKQKALVYSRQRIDLLGLLDGVGPRPVMAKVKRMRDFARAWQECGFGCVIHTAFRVPLSTARGMMDLAPSEMKQMLRALPTSAQVALIDIQRNGPSLAVAADVPAGFDTGMLRQLPIEVHLVPNGERAALLLGMQVDPRTVFATDTTEALDGIGQLDADLPSIAPKVQPLDADVARVLGGLGALTGESRQVGSAFAWRLHLTTSPGVRAAPFEVADAAGFTSPIHGFTPGKADACLRKATEGASAMFEALASAAPDMRGRLLGQGLAELEPSLTCAKNHPQTRPAADGFYRLITWLLALDAEGGQRDTALPQIEAICKRTQDPWICAQPKRLAALPAAAVPDVPSNSAEGVPFPGERVLVTAKGVFVANQPVDLKGLARGDEPVTLVIDKGLTFAAAAPVFKALSGRPLQIEVRRDGRRQAIPLGRAYRTPGAAAPAQAADPLDSIGFEPLPADMRPADLLSAKPLKPRRSDWHLTVQPGTVVARRMATGAVAFDAAMGDGVALKAALETGAIAVLIAPTTPWPEAARALALFGERAQLTELPPPQLSAAAPSAPPATGERNKEVNRVITADSAKLRYCYEKQLRKNPTLAGKVILDLGVAPDGSVDFASATAPAPLQPVGKCIEALARTWRFSPDSKITKVRFPFILSSERSPR